MSYHKKIINNIHKRGFRALLLVLAAVWLSFPDSVLVFALDKSNIERGITQYDLDSDDTCAASDIVSGGISSTLPDETIKKIEALGIKAKVEANLARYTYAQEQTGVPWQLIAALHYREAGLNPNGSVTNGAPLGSGVNVDGVKIPSDPKEDAKLGATIFKNNAKSVYGVDVVSGDSGTSAYGKAFVAYNRGYMYKNWNMTWNKSPYAMNGYDTEHIDMEWNDADSYTSPGGNKLNDLSGTIDGALGALTIVQFLGGVTLTSVSECDGGSVTADTGNIVATAKGLAWHKTISNGRIAKTDATSAYQKAMPRYNGSTGTDEWSDCGVFVSTVMRMSGADKQFPLRGTSVMYSHVSESEKYEVDTTPTLDELEPGDILVMQGHISLFAGNIGNGFMGMEASLHQHVPDYSTSGDVAWMLSQAGVISARITVQGE